MKKHLPLVLFCLLAALSWAETFQVAPQKSFTVTLESNRMTGYHWELSKPLDPRYLVFITKKYYKPAYKMSQNMGHEIWEFKALKEGNSTIYLKYVRPWDEDVPPLKTQNISVSVKTGGDAGAPKRSQQTLAAKKLQELILRKAREAVFALKEQDSEVLVALAHPAKGIRFSPYALVDKKKDVVLTPAELFEAYTKDRTYDWGEYKGPGGAINLSFADYYLEFIYDRDFAVTGQLYYDSVKGKSKTMNNSSAAYPNGIIVEYYSPGSDPKRKGMDWRSLRLVFEKYSDDWYLIGIIHDQWTN